MKPYVVAALCGVFFAATPSWLLAQESQPTVVEPVAESSSLRLAVFVDLAPVTDFQVQIDGEAVAIDSEGMVTPVPPGTFVLAVIVGERVFEKTLSIGDTAEVVLSVSGEASTWDVEGATDVVEKETEVVETVVEPVAISVVVIAAKDGKPVKDASVFVAGQDVECRTGTDGSCNLKVAPGEIDIATVHPSFSAGTLREVEAVADARFEVKVDPAAVTLEDFVVTAPRIEGGVADVLSERKNATTIADVIGAEQMSKQGASNAADALSRVTGITLVGGKFVYVRGLGDRYSSTLLNGSSLPSPEPEKRVVPLDLFPTDLLDSVLIEKTYSPDMPGGFGGGTVVLRTRGIPKAFEADLGVSLGGYSASTFQTGRSGPTGPLDFLGFDAGTRALPANVKAASETSSDRSFEPQCR